MMSKPKIESSEELTGFQVGLQQDDTFDKELLTDLLLRANGIPVDAAFVIPLPIPQFAYNTANLPLQTDYLNGLIMGDPSTENGLQTEISENIEKPVDVKEWQAQLRTTMAEKYPWVPLVEKEQLHDPALCENFIVCVSALYELNLLRTQKLTRHALIDFHSRYKLVLLAHNQPGYRKIGPFVAQIHQWQNLEEFFVVYRKQLMEILQQPASRENHVNVMMHIQGYFNRQQTAEQRNELSRAIHNYRLGHLPLSAPLTQLKRCLSEYPNNYLLTQKYFMLYPNNFIET